MTGWEDRTAVEDAVARAMDDWLRIGDFVDIVRRFGVTNPESLRLTAIGLMSDVLLQGLMVAGNADELGFHPWGGSRSDALLRIVEGVVGRQTSARPWSRCLV